MSITAPELRPTSELAGRRLDERLARAAVAWSLDPRRSAGEQANWLLLLAGGNRTAVERALGRVEAHRSPAGAGTSGRAAALLRLCLATGEWSWGADRTRRP